MQNTYDLSIFSEITIENKRRRAPDCLKAEEIKRNSAEGEKWSRYRMNEPIALKDKKTIVIRRGQNTESISAVKKLFRIEEL